MLLFVVLIGFLVFFVLLLIFVLCVMLFKLVFGDYYEKGGFFGWFNCFVVWVM